MTIEKRINDIPERDDMYANNVQSVRRTCLRTGEIADISWVEQTINGEKIRFTVCAFPDKDEDAEMNEFVEREMDNAREYEPNGE